MDAPRQESAASVAGVDRSPSSADGRCGRARPSRPSRGAPQTRPRRFGARTDAPAAGFAANAARVDRSPWSRGGSAWRAVAHRSSPYRRVDGAPSSSSQPARAVRGRGARAPASAFRRRRTMRLPRELAARMAAPAPEVTASVGGVDDSPSNRGRSGRGAYWVCLAVTGVCQAPPTSVHHQRGSSALSRKMRHNSASGRKSWKADGYLSMRSQCTLV